MNTDHRNVTATELDNKLLAALQELEPNVCIGHFSDYLQTGYQRLLLIQPIGEHQSDKDNPIADMIGVRYTLVAAINLAELEYSEALKQLRELTKAIRKRMRKGVLTQADRPRPTFDIGKPQDGHWLVAEAVISINITERD